MIPIVFIHNGSGENYLECVVKQAQSFDNKVVLIGDESNKHIPCDEHYQISDFSIHSNAFKDVYVPLSTHGQYETFCFQRWFILYEWMRTKQIDKCFYLDSDVLFYGNTDDEAKKFEQFDFTTCHRCVGHASYFTYDGLKDFCKFTYKTYQEKGFDYDRIAAHYHVMQKHNMTGGVCDMTFLEYYARYKNPAGVGENMHIIDGAVYDHCINQQDKFYEMNGNMKNIKFFKGSPYCKRINGPEVRFVALHFQGGHKGLIPQFFKIGQESLDEL